MDDNLIERRREAFEREFARFAFSFERLQMFRRHPNGDYYYAQVRNAFKWFCIALDSAVVELPGDDGMDGHLWGPDVVDAIERAGLRVKS